MRRLTHAGPIDATRAMNIINEYTTAFFNRYLNGQSEALLAGPARQYPEVRLEIWRHEAPNLLDLGARAGNEKRSETRSRTNDYM